MGGAQNVLTAPRARFWSLGNCRCRHLSMRPRILSLRWTTVRSTSEPGSQSVRLAKPGPKGSLPPRKTSPFRRIFWRFECGTAGSTAPTKLSVRDDRCHGVAATRKIVRSKTKRQAVHKSAGLALELPPSRSGPRTLLLSSFSALALNAIASCDCLISNQSRHHPAAALSI